MLRNVWRELVGITTVSPQGLAAPQAPTPSSDRCKGSSDGPRNPSYVIIRFIKYKCGAPVYGDSEGQGAGQMCSVEVSLAVVDRVARNWHEAARSPAPVAFAGRKAENPFYVRLQEEG
jgi:hypothetical protein